MPILVFFPPRLSNFEHKEEFTLDLALRASLLRLGTKRYPGAAGDLVIWRSDLPHSAGLNRGSIPRVAQYVSMSPAPQADEREARARWLAEGLAAERGEGAALELSALGRQLVGLDLWPAAADARL